MLESCQGAGGVSSIYLLYETQVERPKLDNRAIKQAAAEDKFCTRGIRLIKLHFCILLPVHSLQEMIMHVLIGVVVSTKVSCACGLSNNHVAVMIVIVYGVSGTFCV